MINISLYLWYKKKTLALNEESSLTSLSPLRVIKQSFHAPNAQVALTVSQHVAPIHAVHVYLEYVLCMKYVCSGFLCVFGA